MAGPEQSAQALAERAVALINSSHNVVVTGDVYVGAESARDDVLLLAHALEQLAPRRVRRSAPRSQPPRPYPDRIDRNGPVADVADALARGSCVSVSGAEGVGKTYVLRAAAEHARADDGVVWIEGEGRSAGDVLQGVFEELYDANPVIATPEERRSAFAGIRAVVVVDGAPADGAEQIRMELADSVVVLATRTGVWWGGPARDVQLDGLEPADALALLTRRIPDAGEQTAAARLIALLRGNPLRLVQAATLASRRRLPLATVVTALEADPEEELRRLLLESLDDEDRRLMSLLAGASGATLAAERLREFARVPDAAARLQTLERDRLVRSASPRYRAVGVVARPEGMEQHNVAKGVLLDRASLDDLPAAMTLLREAQLGDDIVTGLGREFAPVALYGRRWDAWNEILDRVYVAAQRTRNSDDMAWALHHLGTAAYLRGNVGSAEAALNDALSIRRDLGDERGAAATAHNLDFIARPPGPPDRGDEPVTPKRPGGGRAWVAALAATSLVAVVAGVALATRDGDEPTPTPTPTPTATATATATATPAEVTVTITAPEAGSYQPQQVPPADFACTGAPDTCTATVQAENDGEPRRIDVGSSLPSDFGAYVMTATASVGGEDVATDTVRYIVPFPDEDVTLPDGSTPTPTPP